MTAMQPAERRRQQSRAEARRAILDATEALLVEDGFDAFSMRRLAERCGYTPPTIYHHFGDKQRLIDELVEERFQVLVRSLKRVQTGDDPVANFRAFSIAFARFGLRNPTFYALLSHRPEAESTVPPAAEEARAILEAPLAKLAADGRLNADLDATQQIVWAFLHGFILLRTHRADVLFHKDVLAVGIDSLMQSLIRDPELAPDREETRR
jgi:AcrR family transcriptional regulator